MAAIWLNGRLVAEDGARIDPRDRGFTLGDGLFETIRVRGGTARRLDRHLARLRNGAGVLGIAIPYDDDALARAIAATVGDAADAAVRLTLTRGPAPRGVLPPTDPVPTVLITAAPAPPTAPPARLIVATTTCRNERSPLSRLKSLNYLDGILARREAAARGGDDAVLCNTQGRIAETTIANLFVVRDGVLCTPPLTEGALPGIVRAVIMAACPVVERPITVADLMTADEIILTNSLGVRAVVTIDGTPVGLGGPGPAFAAALAATTDAG